MTAAPRRARAPAPQGYCVGTRGVPGGLRKVRPPHVTGQSHGRGSATGGWAAGQIVPDPPRQGPTDLCRGGRGGGPGCLLATGQDRGCTCARGRPGRATHPAARARARPCAHGGSERAPSMHRASEGDPAPPGAERAAAARPPHSRPPPPALPVLVPARPRGGRRAAQCGRGRAAPRAGPPPPLAHAAGPRRTPLVAALHHCCVTGEGAGRSAGPAENFGET